MQCRKVPPASSSINVAVITLMCRLSLASIWSALLLKSYREAGNSWAQSSKPTGRHTDSGAQIHVRSGPLIIRVPLRSERHTSYSPPERTRPTAQLNSTTRLWIMVIQPAKGQRQRATQAHSIKIKHASVFLFVWPTLIIKKIKIKFGKNKQTCCFWGILLLFQSACCYTITDTTWGKNALVFEPIGFHMKTSKII